MDRNKGMRRCMSGVLSLEWTGTHAPFHVASAPEKLCCSVEPIVTLPQAQMTDKSEDVDTRVLWPRRSWVSLS